MPGPTRTTTWASSCRIAGPCKRATVNLGLRYDSFKGTAPAQTVTGKTPLTPNRADIPLPETPLVHWHDITPRLGLTYDIAGNGKTAIKVSVNKYVEGQAVGSLVGVNAGGAGPHPVSSLVNTTSRTWLDTNLDFIPQCDLTSTAANGECAAVANPGFGSTNTNALAIRSATRCSAGASAATTGSSASASSARSCPRVSVDVGYFRRWYGNFRVTDNLALEPHRVHGLHRHRADGDRALEQRPTADRRSIPTGSCRRRTSRPAPATTAIRSSSWNGADFTVNARPANGLLLFGGVSTGKTTSDSCEVAAAGPGVARARGRSSTAASRVRS